MSRAHDFGGGYVPVSDRREMRLPDCVNPNHVPFGNQQKPDPQAYLAAQVQAQKALAAAQYTAWLHQDGCELWDEAWAKRIADRQAAVDRAKVPERIISTVGLHLDVEKALLASGDEAANKEMLHKVVEFCVGPLLDAFNAVVTGDNRPPKRVGPDDPAHNTARDLIEHLTNDRVTKPARDAVRKALDAADGKIASGAHRSPPNLGRALRGSFDVTGLHTGKTP